MKISLNRFLLIGIAILHSHIWIVLTQEIFKAITYTEDDDRPKKEQNKLQRSLAIFVSSSSSLLKFYKNSSRLSNAETLFSTILDTNPVSLLNASIQHSFIDETLYHSTASPLVDVPTSNLLNSLYLLESSYLLENSDNESDTVLPLSSTLPLLLSPSVSSSSSSSSSLQEINLSGAINQRTNSSLSHISQSHTAENHFLIMTSSQIPSSSHVFEYKSTESLQAMKSNNIQINASTYSEIHDSHLLNSYPIYNTNIKEKQPTVSLSEKINTDFSNFMIETSVIVPNSLAKEYSSEQISDLKSPTATFYEISSSKSAPFLNAHSNSPETNLEIEKLNNSNYFHEIISDKKSINNKTFRNEDAEIDEIISGIIHLLAGNVQVVRATNNAIYPTRLHVPPALVSTRINNRGPIKPSAFSQTVVVFSQPPNKGNQGHLLPSTIQNHQFIRIRPTKIGEHLPPTLIHFYNQVPNQPPLVPQPNRPFPPPHHQIPFRGEVFIPNNKVKIPLPPEEYVKPSYSNSEKQLSVNGAPVNKYQHFIFSDNAASSVIVLRPSKLPPLETVLNDQPKTENSNFKNTSQNFEVLIDDTVKKKVFISQIAPLSSNTFDVLNEKLTSYTPIAPESTKTENIFPHGPVTDWVPFSERPSVRPNEAVEDSNVSIIMHPITFDLTVSNSVGGVGHSNNITVSEDSSSIPVTYNTISETYPVSDADYLKNNSQLSYDEYLQSDSHLISSKDMNGSMDILEVSKLTSRITEVFSTPKIDITMTPTHTIHSSTKPLTITPNFDLRSSYNSLKEKNTVTKITEIPLQFSPSIVSSLLSNISSVPKFSSTSSMSPKSNQSSINSMLSIPSISKASRTTTVTSTQITEQTLIGRPIVIPVDIEEVRPFVGPINPFNQDQSRENHYERTITRDQGSTTEMVTKAIASTTPRTSIIRSPQRPRPNTVRIDTCIVGDDSTCDITLNETCKTEMGISSCHCRPGYARSYARGPCIPIVSLILSMKVDRFGNSKMAFSPKYLDKHSEEYRIMEFESKLALSSLISQIPAFARTFLGLQINTFYPIGDKVVINSTIFLEEKESTRTQAVRLRLRQLIGEAIKNKKQNIGDSRLYVEGSYSPVAAIEDVNECSDVNLNDCSTEGMCFNVFGTYLCKCRSGYVDPFMHDERRGGRKCSACSPEYCSFHGKCFVERDKRLCKCHGNYIGSRCEIDGEVLGVALGASLAAIIIILLTLGCLCIWNRKWKQQQQKAEVLSSRSYNSNPTMMMTTPYHLTMEDRMRWAQISDVIKNATMHPNPDHPYMSPTPVPHDQATFANRCQPSDNEIPWYESRNRPRSRLTAEYPVVSGPACFEMDIPVRSPYAGAGYLSSKRPKHPTARY